MKITIYELLGLIKDGKAPKKIKVDSYILDFVEGETNWKLAYIDESEDYLFRDYYICLNDEVEIIEEEKDIEELSLKDLAISINEIYNDNVDVLMNKINELVREVNRLKGGKNDC